MLFKKPDSGHFLRCKRTKDQAVALQQYRLTVWYNIFAFPLQQDNKCLRWQIDLAECPSTPGMLPCYHKLDKLNRYLIGIVIERFQYRVTLIDHIEFSRNCRKQCSLEKNGKQDNSKYNMINIIFQFQTLRHHHSKHDGCGSTQPGPANKDLLCCFGSKWRQNQKHRQRPRNKRHDQCNHKGRQNHLWQS